MINQGYEITHLLAFRSSLGPRHSFERGFELFNRATASTPLSPDQILQQRITPWWSRHETKKYLRREA